ncbi:hypothetical protein VNO77_14696 [Canavalia gladiata]|uniref:Uncharacterized protein n=1 Tax=Canavalia gladiata TaxID=3824 RepID=A0AAN9M225_CANGL
MHACIKRGKGWKIGLDSLDLGDFSLLIFYSLDLQRLGKKVSGILTQVSWLLPGSLPKQFPFTCRNRRKALDLACNNGFYEEKNSYPSKSILCRGRSFLANQGRISVENTQKAPFIARLPGKILNCLVEMSSLNHNSDRCLHLSALLHLSFIFYNNMITRFDMRIDAYNTAMEVFIA